MQKGNLIARVTNKAQSWLGDSYDAETRAEVQRMLDNEDKRELIDAFYKDWSLARVARAASWVQVATA